MHRPPSNDHLEISSMRDNPIVGRTVEDESSWHFLRSPSHITLNPTPLLTIQSAISTGAVVKGWHGAQRTTILMMTYQSFFRIHLVMHPYNAFRQKFDTLALGTCRCRQSYLIVGHVVERGLLSWCLHDRSFCSRAVSQVTTN